MADLKNGLAVDCALRIRCADEIDVACFFAQARAVAVGAGLDAAVAGQLLAYGGRVGLAVTPLEVGDHTLERVLFRVLAAGVGT